MGNYEQVVVKWWEVLQRKRRILKGVGKRLPRTTTVGWTPVNSGLSRVVVGSKPEREHLRGFSNASKLRNFEFTPCSRSNTLHTPQNLRYMLCGMCTNIPRPHIAAVYLCQRAYRELEECSDSHVSRPALA